ncbi:MAG: alanine racemase [Candidatus Hydrogenedentes bacterium]|nr:alanine racemase [Candidatus Hydrogenedentota bacterium]
MKVPSSSRAYIDLNAYGRNLGVVRSMIPKECGIIAVVKGNAYGHGAVPIARRAVVEGAEMLGVATVKEAVELRAAGIDAPILVLVQPAEDVLSAAVEYDLRLTISDVAVAERVGELARRANRVVPLHCKIDTGMGRQGFSMDDAVSEMMRLTRISHIDIEGVCTHFSIAENGRDPFTANQVRQFRQVLKLIEKEGIPYEMTHAANSAAVVGHPAAALDMVRPGLMTYGVWPTDSPPAESPLRPVLRWETQVILVKDIKKGDSVGYGRTFTAGDAIRVAVIPVGYADGYKHSLSNRASVLIRGKRCAVRGRISMDQTVVEVSHVQGISIGDTVTLIGSDGRESITAEELAERGGTIPYEILTGIGPRVEREYVDDPSES